MYCQFYSLKERPFNVTADPGFFFLTRRHKEAFSHLLYGVGQRKGIIVITGEIGAGKTTLCRFFIEQLNKNTRIAFILNPYFSEIQLLEAITKDFGINVPRKTRLSFVWEFNRFLLGEAESGNNVVLIIDEAQNLRPRQLEQIRLLSNLETEKDKLMQIVLVGQPDLNHRLDLHDLRQLQQRIIVRYHIMPLDKNEVKEYIYHRLKVAGSPGHVNFTEEVFDMIFDFSGGIPRLINIICDRALLAGFTAGTNMINPDIINRCAEELNTYFGTKS